MRLKDSFFTPSIERSIVLMAILALIGSLQLLIVVMMVFSFIPITPTAFAKDLFPYIQNTDVHPNRRIFFLHMWVGSGILIHGIGLWLLRNILGQRQTDHELVRLITANGCWLLLQLFVIFKIIIYPQLPWTQPLLYVLLGCSFLTNVFWPEVNAALFRLKDIVLNWSSRLPVRVAGDMFLVAFILSALWITDPSRVWAVIGLQGNKALVQADWNMLSPLIQGVDYTKALPWLMMLSMVYYVLFYLLLRRIYRSILLSGCAVLLAVKWQYFHQGIFPNIWQFPSKTVIPLLPDIFFWLCLWFGHRGRMRQSGLWLAGLIAGIAVAYHVSTGIWLWLAWMTYLIVTRKNLSWGLFPWGIVLSIWVFCFDPHGAKVLIQQYTSSLAEVISGKGVLPYYESLKGRHFFAFTLQFIIPVIYILTLITIRTHPLKFLIIPMAVYGLGLFSIHAWQPSLSNYYSVSAPLVVVLSFWAAQALRLLPEFRRVVISALLLVFYAAALLTNNVYAVYPNIWNMAGINWEQVKASHQERQAGNTSR